MRSAPDLLETVNRLIGYIYEAALDPARWETVLKDLTEELHCTSAIFRVLDPLEPSVDYAISVGYSEQALQIYADHYVALDPFIKGLNAKPVGFIGVGQQVISDRDFVKTEYYNDCFRPYGRFHVAGGYLVREHGRVMQFGLQRERKAGPFGEQDLRFIELLVPHIARSFKIARHIRQCGLHETALRHTLDALSSAILLIDRQLKVHFANRAGERLIRFSDQIAIAHQRVNFTDADVAAEIKVRLRLCAGNRLPAESRPANTSETVYARRRDGLRIVVAPLPPQLPHYPLGEDRAEAILFLSETDAQADLPRALLSGLYGLTPAETRLVEQLAQGASLETICERFRLTRNTVKTQLRAAFRKTGARTQADLLRLVLSGPESAIRSAP